MRRRSSAAIAALLVSAAACTDGDVGSTPPAGTGGRDPGSGGTSSGGTDPGSGNSGGRSSGGATANPGGSGPGGSGGASPQGGGGTATGGNPTGSGSSAPTDASVESDAPRGDASVADASAGDDGASSGTDGAAGDAAPRGDGAPASLGPCLSNLPPDLASFEWSFDHVPVVSRQGQDPVHYVSSVALSRDGRVLAGSFTYEYKENGTRSRWFRWTGEGFVALDVPQGFDDGQVADVDCDGSTLVGLQRTKSLFQSSRPFRWRASSGFATLPYEPFVSSYPSDAHDVYAVSADGRVVLGQANDELSKVSTVKWVGDAYGERILTPPHWATGMNASGDVLAGAFYLDPGGGRAFVAVGAGAPEDMEYPGRLLPGVLVSAGGETLVFTAIGHPKDPTTNFPVVWSRRAGFEPLGRGVPRAVSAGGRVIVGSISFSARADDSSFVWDRKHGMRHLRTILEGYGVALPDGWTVAAVNDISDDARVLAGSLKKPGPALLTTQAFRVVLPANAFD